MATLPYPKASLQVRRCPCRKSFVAYTSVGKAHAKWVQAWSDAYLMMLLNSGVQSLLQAGSFGSQCTIVLFQLPQCPSHTPLILAQVFHAASQGCVLGLQGVHQPTQSIMMPLHCLQVPLQVLRLHKRNWFLSMYIKLFEPRRVFAKLRLIPHTGMSCVGILRQSVESIPFGISGDGLP